MSAKVLDDDIRYAKFKKPVTLTVNKEQWIAYCDELHKKSNIGSFILIVIGAVIAVFTFILFFLVAVGTAFFINRAVRRKFDDLRELADHTYSISGTQLIDTYQGNKQTVTFDKIKDIEFHKWGVELDTKNNRKMVDKNPKEGKFLIPCMVNDYGRVVATFEDLKKK